MQIGYPDPQKPVGLENTELRVAQPTGFPRIDPFLPAGYPDSCSALLSSDIVLRDFLAAREPMMDV